MSDDYLWDRSGKPDPETQELESQLGTFRFRGSTPDFSDVSIESSPRRAPFRFFTAPRLLIAAPALAALVLAIVFAWPLLPRRPSYRVVSLVGAPRVGSTRIESSGRLPVGQWLETDASSRARISVGDIGQVEVEPNTRIGLTLARPNEHRLSLQRGVMQALIWAPPGQFYVATPSAVAADLGCAYKLEVDDAGAGLLTVTMGWVAFERNGRESFVPAGARCETRPGTGPGTPYQEDASAAFRAALARLDFETAGKESRMATLNTVLAEAREKDALTLWHLLYRDDEDERSRVYDRLAALVPPPAGVTRAGIVNRNQGMLDVWWDVLGLGDTNWWRMWKRPWPANDK